MPKRSEVWFGEQGNLHDNRSCAVLKLLPYFTQGSAGRNLVYSVAMCFGYFSVCRVADLEDDDPFPPTTPEPTSGTLGDRLLSTALRERK